MKRCRAALHLVVSALTVIVLGLAGSPVAHAAAAGARFVVQHTWQDGFIEETARRGDRYYDPVNPVPPPYPRQSGYETEVRRIIPVYKWEYSLGPGTFLKTLVFHGDTLVGIVQGPRQ